MAATVGSRMVPEHHFTVTARYVGGEVVTSIHPTHAIAEETVMSLLKAFGPCGCLVHRCELADTPTIHEVTP
jgi:hypothetical protein